MGGMDMGSGMGEAMSSPLLGGAGDIAYPHYLANGRVPAAPVTLSAKPGQRARLRLINAGSDTAFKAKSLYQRATRRIRTSPPMNLRPRARRCCACSTVHPPRTTRC
jgi:hypothetical protein